MKKLTLGIDGFTFNDLYNSVKLAELYSEFVEYLRHRDAELCAKYVTLVQGKKNDSSPAASAILMEVAKVVELFVVQLFRIEKEISVLKTGLADEIYVMKFKGNFLKRATIRKKDKPEDQSEERFTILTEEYTKIQSYFPTLDWTKEEVALATAVEMLSRCVDGTNNDFTTDTAKEILNTIEDYYFLRKIRQPETLTGWMSTRVPKKIDYNHLVHVERPNANIPELIMGSEKHWRRRDGFSLTDDRGTMHEAMGEIEYCMICHEREKDSCSKGMKEKDGSLKSNPLGIKLAGCPLEEHISEMHALKGNGSSIGALALITINNPMCAGTGHRICNDCMKACIYQKQEPVNIPKVETSVLTDVLALPWGFEIYALLTRWNPLNIERPYALPYNGKKVCVVGLGPAGYTLSQYLLNEGFAVAGVDGLKIEPLPVELTGNKTTEPMPIYDYNSEIVKPLDERILEGFGGVSEYGITVRWDKNFLTTLHLMLSRRRTFTILDGVRFGGTMTVDDAWELGFDHVAVAAGAGKPTLVSMKNNLSRGIRKASDFLMTLQLTGAAKKISLANLQIRMPAVVVGGGLTGIDTTTEAMAYYPVQVEKFYERTEVLHKELGDEKFWKLFDVEEQDVAKEFIEHGKQIKEERQRAAENHELPNFIPLLQSWGGVTMAYRKKMQDSPAYRLNHEEIEKALEEGIYILENMSPVEAKLDEYGAVKAMEFERYKIDEEGKYYATGEYVEMPAKSVFVAAGTSPNTMYEKEYPGTFKMDKRGQYFQAFEMIEVEA
ncbi:MAG: FAD-dependent oxidoreductase [Candidatus Kapaibacterium sp.]